MKVLIIDDRPDMRTTHAALVKACGHEPTAVEGFREIEAWAADNLESFHVALVDKRLSAGEDGLELGPRLRERAPDICLIMLTAFGETKMIVQATKAGFYDFIDKPIRLDQLRDTLDEVNDRIQQIANPDLKALGIIGKSPAMVKMAKEIHKIAPTVVSVLITGESGVGKEVVAKAIHRRSKRSEVPLVVINCAALPKDLIESELFGYEKGAFTGAQQKKEGLFKLADGGTIFLDEIAEMPPEAEAKLLRVLEDGTFRPTGSPQEVSVDVRVIAATNQNVQARRDDGSFRSDLFYRFARKLEIVPLREHAEDIPLLAFHFVERFSGEYERALPVFTDEALRILSSYKWPGNVRELRNVIQQIILDNDNRWINGADVTNALPKEARSLSIGTESDAAALVGSSGDRRGRAPIDVAKYIASQMGQNRMNMNEFKEGLTAVVSEKWLELGIAELAGRVGSRDLAAAVATALFETHGLRNRVKASEGKRIQMAWSNDKQRVMDVVYRAFQTAAQSNAQGKEWP